MQSINTLLFQDYEKEIWDLKLKINQKDTTIIALTEALSKSQNEVKGLKHDLDNANFAAQGWQALYNEKFIAMNSNQNNNYKEVVSHE